MSKPISTMFALNNIRFSEKASVSNLAIMPWSSFFKDSLLETLSNQVGATFDPTQISANLVKLEVYCTDLTTTITDESPAYTVPTCL